MRRTLGKVFLCFLVVSFVAFLLVQPVRAEFNPGGVVAEANSFWVKLTSFVFPLKKSPESVLPMPQPPSPAPVLGVADDLLNSLKARVGSLEQQVSGLLNAPAPTAISPSSLSLVSSNLLRNSSFEADSGGQPRQWNYQLDSNSGNTFKSAEGIHSGSYGLKVVGGGSGNFGISQPNTKTTPGRTYTFSLYVKIINAPTTTVRLGFWDEQNNGYGPMKDFSFSGNRDWTRINMTATTTGLITDSKNWFPLVEVHGLTAGAVYLDDALLTEGSILTAYNSMQASGSNSSGGFGDGAILTSTSGDIYPAISGNGSLGTTNNKWSALYLSNASIDSSGNLTANGSVTLGSTSSGTITANAQFNTSLIPSSNQSYDLGSSSLRWNNVYANTLNINGSLTSSSNASYSGTLGVGGQASMSAYLTFDAANPQINATNNRNLTLGAVNTGRVNLFSSSNYVDSSGNLALAANLALAGSAVSASNYLTAPNWSVTTAGLETLASNLAVNGGSITTSQTTANVFNATATTINIGGAGTTNFNNASASGTLGAGGEASLSAKLILGSVTPQINATNNRPLQVAFQNTGQTQFYNTSNYIDSGGNEALAANLGIAGSAVSSSNYLTAPNFSVSTAGLGTFASNVAVNGGSVTTTAATGNLFNANATTLNIGGAATTISIGASTGTTTVNNGLTVSGALTQSGNATVSGTLGVGGEASLSAKLILGSLTPQINTTNFRPLQLGFLNTGQTQFYSSANYIDSGGNEALAANLGIAGSAVSASNYLTAPNWSVTTAGAETLASNLAVNGGSVTTTAATGNLFNTNATTLNVGGAATTISLGAATGTTTVNNNATASGTLGVGGNASMSAYLTLGATNPQINVTNNRALVLGAANTGSVQFFSSSNAINSAGSITVAAGGGLDVAAAGTLALGNATATTINIGQSSGAGTTINIGTAAQADTITIGNVTGATAVNINAGSGLINLSAGNSATASAFVINTNAGANAAGLAVKLGNTALATTNNFATFLDGNGKIVGKINAASATSVGYQTQGIDYAEWFFKASGAGNMPVHTLVCFNDAGTVQPCAEGGQILGIVSDQAGFIGGMNREGPNAALVGLVGQLRLNVVGPVAAGDFLTSSSTPGSARKATKPGQVIGVAMENSSGPTGLVYTSINPGFADPSAVQVAQTLGAVTQQVADLTAKVNNNATVTAAAVGGPTTNTALSTLSQFDSVLANKLEVKGLAAFDADIKVSGEAAVGSLNVSGAITVNFVAGEDLSAGDVVSLASDGAVHKFGNSTPVIGIVTSAVTKGNNVKVAVGGIVSGLANLTVGQRYLGADGGKLTTAIDNTKLNQVVGLAVSNSSLLVQVGIYNLPSQAPSTSVSLALPTTNNNQPNPISPVTTVSQTPTSGVVAGSSTSTPSGQQSVATSSGVVNPGTSQVGSNSASLK